MACCWWCSSSSCPRAFWAASPRGWERGARPAPDRCGSRRRIPAFLLEKQPAQRQITAMSGSRDLGNALLASASDAIIATDREGRIIFWNPGAERIFGFSAAEAVGQSLDLIVPENL